MKGRKLMKAAVYEGPKRIVLREVNKPEIGPSDILVKVKACGICGSDLHSYKEGLYVEPEQIMGHEFSGDVVDVGREVKDIKIGDRVTAHPLVYCYECSMCLAGLYHLCLNKWKQSIGYGLPGAFAEFVRIPNAKLNHTVYKLPNEINYEEGALIEPIATAIHAVQLANPKIAQDIVVVFGAGPIGLFVLQVLKNLNPFKIVVCEISSYRLGMAQKLGADIVINSKKYKLVEVIKQICKLKENSTHCVDLVIECVGSGVTLKQALEVIKPAGRIILIGLGPKTPIDVTFLVQNQITIQGAFCYLHEFNQAIELVRTKKIKVDSIITHKFSLDNITQAFETQLNPELSLKVVVCPS